MRTFDPDTFMQQTVDQPMETELKLCPEGEYPNSFIDDFNSDAVKAIDFTYKKGDRAGEDGTMYKCSLPVIINDDKAKAELNRDKVVVYKEFNLDMKSDGSGLDFGINKNIELGRVRAAAGQNNAGPWSLGNLKGAGPFVVTVVHESGKRKDGSEWKQARIGKITRQS